MELAAEDNEETFLPQLSPAELSSGERLAVVATTNIIEDVVSQVGGNFIHLVGLMPVGADPHGFAPTPRDLIALNDAHVIFINDLGLEETLNSVLRSLDGEGVFVSVNTGVETIQLGEQVHSQEEHSDGVNPHTWFSVHAVMQWVDNIEQVLTALDPAHADAYASNANDYLKELAALEVELEKKVVELPPKQRKLVTDHDSFGYFAEAYGFDIVGTVIPSLSTVASPSAAQLAALEDWIEAEGVKAVIVGNTVNSSLSKQLAADTGIEIVTVYTGSLGEPDGPAGTYLDFMRYNMTKIVDALK